MRPYPTLGLLYISAFLRREGFDVEIFDTTFSAREQLFDRLAEGRGVIGIYTNLMTRRPVLDIVAVGEAAGLDGRAWAARSRPTIPVSIWQFGADVVVVGEGETTMAELLPALAARGPHNLHGVAGTVFRDRRWTGGDKPGTQEDRRLGFHPLAGPGPDRPGALCGCMARKTRHGQREYDHGARLPVQMQLVLACRFRLYPPPPQLSGQRGRTRAHREHVPAGSGLVRGRRVHDQPSMALQLCERIEAAQPARAV